MRSTYNQPILTVNLAVDEKQGLDPTASHKMTLENASWGHGPGRGLLRRNCTERCARGHGCRRSAFPRVL